MKSVGLPRTPLALTMGDPAGVGGEIALKAWLRRKETGLPPFVLLDDPARLSHLCGMLGFDVPTTIVHRPAQAFERFADALPILPVELSAKAFSGRPDPANAPAIIGAIERGVALVRQGQAAALVTNPIHKAVLYRTGFSFHGHTEYLAHLAGINTPPVMMLACRQLKAVPVTTHVSLAEAVRSLTKETIVAHAAITAKSLSQDFGVANPRLAVAGLNPHAGEGGGMGLEDQEIIYPAVLALRARGIGAFGPLPPDTMFTDAARKTYDAAICMYHDQGLIPMKTLGFSEGVNVTLGLPFVRTSPSHGTAFDIAGTGRASEGSLVEALKLAALMAVRREAATE